MSSDSVNPSVLIDAQTLSVDVLEIFATWEVEMLESPSVPEETAVQCIEIAKLPAVMQRMHGRAIASIVSDVSVSMLPSVNQTIAAIVCVVPGDVAASNLPRTSAEVFSCGGTVLIESATRSSGGSLYWGISVSKQLCGGSLETLASKPPLLCARALTSTSDKKVTLAFRFSIKISGYTWLPGFRA